MDNSSGLIPENLDIEEKQLKSQIPPSASAGSSSTTRFIRSSTSKSDISLDTDSFYRTLQDSTSLDSDGKQQTHKVSQHARNITVT